MDFSSYDSVGAYDQNRVNGFTPELIRSFVEAVNPQSGMLILDAMAGNGNLTCDILRFCCEEDHRVYPLPEIVVFELSTTQINFTQEALAHVPSVLCVHGDILSIQDHCVPGIFDVVMIKSGTHVTDPNSHQVSV
jgi:16S rRNA A1518/A1519 N6-dimethyltransferase RsmA/KsgA/DIM1 with predicted DNA glycosylase/AP lyase activity